MDWKELEKMTIVKLREEALKHPDQIKGVRGKSKPQLMDELATVPGIEKPHVLGLGQLALGKRNPGRNGEGDQREVVRVGNRQRDPLAPGSAGGRLRLQKRKTLYLGLPGSEKPA